MVNDPELKAMSEVFDALQGLDSDTRQRAVEWVIAKLASNPSPSNTGAKRGPKPGFKSKGKKRGPKPGSKRAGKKRGPKKGHGGRPPGSKNIPVAESYSKSKGRRGRPRKIAI